MSDLDVRIEELLESWRDRLGRPACAAGCSRCCESLSAVATAPEALELLSFVDALPDDEARGFRESWGARTATLAELVDAQTDPQAALNELVALGPCPFLVERHCGVYAARPDPCRAYHVWHDASFCGNPAHEAVVPAELVELRVARLHERMMREFVSGRRPFWGQLPVVCLFLDGRREAYWNGADLAGEAAPVWVATEMLVFPSQEDVEADIARWMRIFAEEPEPAGLPRAERAVSRSDLAARPAVP